MIPSMLAARLGMPETAPKKKAAADPASSLNAALKAHKAGDHHTAKKHALAAVNALHRLAGAAPMPAGPAGPAGPSAPGAC